MYDFVNAFIGDVNRPWLEDKILLMYRCSPNSMSIDNIFQNNKYYYGSYWLTIKGESYVIYIFNIPFKYRIQIQLIKEGYVSSLDVSSKRIITNFWKNNEHNTYYEVHGLKNTSDQKELTYELIIEEDYIRSPIDSFLED